MTPPSQWRQKLYSAVGIPFILSQWTPYTLDFKGSPKVSVEGKQLRISTERTAGGFAYFLPEPIPLDSESVRFSWNWAVERFPIAETVLPLKKSTEDFALRVGLLISDGESRISIPGKFKMALEKRSLDLSYVLFYCATPNEIEGTKCESSPYHKKVINCFKKASSTNSAHSALPLKDLRAIGYTQEKQKLHIFGIWLFADSDNSGSSSTARVSELSLLSGLETTKK